MLSCNDYNHFLTSLTIYPQHSLMTYAIPSGGRKIIYVIASLTPHHCTLGPTGGVQEEKSNPLASISPLLNNSFKVK